jgi:predicted DNA binding protein
VDNILIIYDQEKTNHQQIIQTDNNIHPNLSFKHEIEDNGNIVFLDLTLHRNETNIMIDKYRKPTTTSTYTATQITHKNIKRQLFASYSIDYIIYHSQNNRNKKNGPTSFT